MLCRDDIHFTGSKMLFGIDPSFRSGITSAVTASGEGLENGLRDVVTFQAFGCEGCHFGRDNVAIGHHSLSKVPPAIAS